MDLKEYLNLDEINFANEEEVIKIMTDPRLVRFVESEARLLMNYDELWQPELRSIELLFRVFTGCARDVCNSSQAVKLVDILIDRRLKIARAVQDMVALTDCDGPSVKVLKSHWQVKNDYDSLCNPETNKPHWDLILTVYYA